MDRRGVRAVKSEEVGGPYRWRSGDELVQEWEREELPTSGGGGRD